MTSNAEPSFLEQLRDLQQEVDLARRERNALRSELKAMKRYVAILVQADLERDPAGLSVLVLRDPVNADSILNHDGVGKPI